MANEITVKRGKWGPLVATSMKRGARWQGTIYFGSNAEAREVARKILRLCGERKPKATPAAFAKPKATQFPKLPKTWGKLRPIKKEKSASHPKLSMGKR